MDKPLGNHRLQGLLTHHCPDLALFLAGKESIMRSMVFGALDVANVPRTRWPVSAAEMAREMVSVSQFAHNDNIRSSRRAARRALAYAMYHGPFVAG